MVLQPLNKYQVWFRVVCWRNVVSSTFWPIIWVFLKETGFRLHAPEDERIRVDQRRSTVRTRSSRHLSNLPAINNTRKGEFHTVWFWPEMLICVFVCTCRLTLTMREFAPLRTPIINKISHFVLIRTVSRFLK